MQQKLISPPCRLARSASNKGRCPSCGRPASEGDCSALRSLSSSFLGVAYLGRLRAQRSQMVLPAEVLMASGSGLARGWRPQPLSRMVVALPRWRRSVASLRTSQSVTDSLLRGIQLATFCHREWRERLARDLDGLPMGLIAATPQIPLLSRTG